MTRSLSGGLAAALLAALTLGPACTTVSVASRPDAGSLDAGQGVVIVSITGNTARVGQFDTLTLQEAGKPTFPRRVVLNHVSRGLSRDTALFLAAVSPGEYELLGLQSGEMMMTFGDGMRKLNGSIRVEAGKVHDLGRLVLTGLNFGVIVGRSALVTSNADLVRRFAPEQAPHLQGPAAPGWTRPRSPDDQVEEYAQATPVGADALTELAGGALAAGSRLGTILFRPPDGRWATARTGGLESILWVTEAPASLGRVVAVGELGTLALVERSGKVRRLGTGNLPDGNLVFVSGDLATGWTVALQAGKSVTFFHSPRLEDGDWRPLRSVTLGASIWTGSADRVWAWPTKAGFGYAATSGELALYDCATGTFTDRHGPAKETLKAAGPAGPGVLAAVTRGLGSKTFVSRDEGLTWERLEVPSGARVALPLVAPDGRWVVQGGSASKGVLFESAKGQVWLHRSEKVGIEDRLFVLPTLGMFSVDAGGDTLGIASIARSTDSGATWKVEYSNFNRDLWERKAAKK